MPKRTLIFGGAFDMPHRGHMDSARVALNHMFDHECYEELWFLPCFSDAFGVKKMTDPKHRVAMLEILVNEMSDMRFRICTDEIEMANGAGTYAVVKHMLKTYPGREFSYLIGNDQANLIRNWRNSRLLVLTIPFTVIKRAGVHAWYGSMWYRRSPHFFIDTVPTKKPISSTSIRKDFRDQWDEWKTNKHIHLTHGVQKYIISNGLYKKTEEDLSTDAKLNFLLGLQ